MTDSWESGVDHFKEILMSFQGGSVDIKKTSSNGIAFMRLNRPEKHNAISGKMMVDMRECIMQLETWEEGKAVIVYGEGDSFCSGGDLYFAKESGKLGCGYDMGVWMNETLTRLKSLPMISVCLLRGPAIGGGAEIATSCDYVLATESAKLGFVHGKMGIITAWGGATRLASKIGQHKALDLLLTSKILNAKECFEIGLADEVICAEICGEAIEKCQAWLESKIIHDTRIIRAFKSVISKTTSNQMESAQFELQTFSPFWGGDLNVIALARNVKHLKENQ